MAKRMIAAGKFHGGGFLPADVASMGEREWAPTPDAPSRFDLTPTVAQCQAWADEWLIPGHGAVAQLMIDASVDADGRAVLDRAGIDAYTEWAAAVYFVR